MLNSNHSCEHHSNMKGSMPPVPAEVCSRANSVLRLTAVPPTLDLRLDHSMAVGWQRLIDEERIPDGSELLHSPRIVIAPLNPANKAQAEEDPHNVWILEPESVEGQESSRGFRGNEDAELSTDSPVSKEGRVVILKRNVSGLTLRANDETVNDSLDAMRLALRSAHEVLDVPYVHLWYYPEKVPSVFLLRVDVDYVVPEALTLLLELSSRYGVKGTYFVNVSGEEEYEDEIGQGQLERPTTPDRLEELKQLKASGNEIANHGYWHDIFSSAAENKENIDRAQIALRECLQVECAGFAAPGAESTEELAKALNGPRFTYVANTLADRGALPYRPNRGNLEQPYEIPGCSFSDLCFEGIQESDKPLALEDTLAFYRELISSHVESGQPVSLIVHPHLAGRVGRDYFEPIFKLISEQKLTPMTHLEMAGWWSRRARSAFSARQQSDGALTLWSSLEHAVVEVLFRGERQLIEIGQPAPKEEI